MMKILVACEESQAVCKAFREKGHEAYSCDIQKCSGGAPNWHILMDAKAVIYGGVMRLQTGEKIYIDKWDLIIAHPPCTYLTSAATQCHSLKTAPINWINARTHNRIEAMKFFMMFVDAPCDRIAIENPKGVMNTAYRKPDQIIHPYYFAESKEDKENYWTKATCLWLKGLPLLEHGELASEPYEHSIGKNPDGGNKNWTESVATKNRAIARSKTFPGIARAMAEQWG